MSNRIKNNLKNLVGQTLNQYYSKVKPTISDLRYKQEYQNRIIECMVGEVDDNYITTPETDNPIVKLEHSKEGLVKVPSIKGKTILVDAEGNETDTPGEGCRLVSVGEDEDNKMIILSKNKNLFDKNKVTLDKKIIGATGSVNNEVGVALSDYIEVIGGCTYYYNYGDSYINRGLAYFDKDKKYISGVGGTNVVKTLSPINAKYVRFNCSIVELDNAQFELGEVKTNKVDHKHHKTEILLNEPLYEGNSVKNNILTKKYIKLILDGSENWNSFREHTNTVSALLGKLQDKLKVVKNVNTQLKNYAIPYGYHQGDTEHFYMDANFALYLSKDKGITSLDLFKEYLSNNNFELIVELEEPIIEELPNGITLQGFDDTTMYIENSIVPTVSYGYNALIPYKEELRTQKEEVETNTLDIENNIIPYLMDMEYNLMLMEDNE